jgi:hypothetical protein
MSLPKKDYLGQREQVTMSNWRDGLNGDEQEFPVRCGNNRTPHRYGPSCAGDIEVVTDEPAPAREAGNVAPETRASPNEIIKNQLLSELDAPRVQVAGRMEQTFSEHTRRLGILIEEEQSKPLPNNTLIAALCDSIRLAREATAIISTPAFELDARAAPVCPKWELPSEAAQMEEENLAIIAARQEQKAKMADPAPVGEDGKPDWNGRREMGKAE